MGSKDIGVKVSQIGWDVKTAGDANLYFSSSWPLLKIETTDTVNADAAGTNITHDLKYPPLAFAWNESQGLYPCEVTSKYITIPSISVKSRYFIFRLDLTNPYQSPVVHSPIEPGQNADHNFGIKFAKEGKSLESDDFRDFTIHSSVRSPLHHATLYQKLGPVEGQGGKSLRWIPDLPYTPVFFAYYSSDNDTFTPLSTIAQFGTKVIVTPGHGWITISGPLDGWGSLVLLKDPLDAVQRTEVYL